MDEKPEFRWQSANGSCVVLAYDSGLIIGQDLHMNGVDSPAHMSWTELEALTDVLSFLRMKHIEKQYQD